MSDAARGQRVTSAKNVLMSCLHSTAMASAGAGLYTFIMLPVIEFNVTTPVFILEGGCLTFEHLIFWLVCVIFSPFSYFGF